MNTPRSAFLKMLTLSLLVGSAFGTTASAESPPSLRQRVDTALQSLKSNIALGFDVATGFDPRELTEKQSEVCHGVEVIATSIASIAESAQELDALLKKNRNITRALKNDPEVRKDYRRYFDLLAQMKSQTDVEVSALRSACAQPSENFATPVQTFSLAVKLQAIAINYYGLQTAWEALSVFALYRW